MVTLRVPTVLLIVAGSAKSLTMALVTSSECRRSLGMSLPWPSSMVGYEWKESHVLWWGKYGNEILSTLITAERFYFHFELWTFPIISIIAPLNKQFLHIFTPSQMSLCHYLGLAILLYMFKYLIQNWKHFSFTNPFPILPITKDILLHTNPLLILPLTSNCSNPTNSIPIPSLSFAYFTAIGPTILSWILFFVPLTVLFPQILSWFLLFSLLCFPKSHPDFHTYSLFSPCCTFFNPISWFLFSSQFSLYSASPNPLLISSVFTHCSLSALLPQIPSWFLFFLIVLYLFCFLFFHHTSLTTTIP